MRNRFNPLTLAFVITLPAYALLAGIWLWNPAGNHWLTIEPPKAQCEAYDVETLRVAKQLDYRVYAPTKIDRLLREPQNTFSNLFYATAGVAILIAGRRPPSFGLGIALCFLGFGSGMYHASLLPEWRLLDILGVYAVLYLVAWIGACHLAEPLNRSRLRATIGTILIWLAAIWTGIHRNDVRIGGLKVFDSTYVFVAAVTLGILLLLLACWRAGPPRAILIRPLAVLLLAAPLSFAGGIGDRFGGFWAAPEAFIQGHSVWHLFGAVALLAAYEVYAAAGFDHSTISQTGRHR